MDKVRTYYRIKKIIGDSVLAKCGNKCTVCGSVDDLVVHHIIKTAITSPRYNDAENLTVLCRPCHMSHHRREGDILTKGGRRGNNNPVVCAISGCANNQHAKSLCKKHYAAEFRVKQGW